jgi:hypothetical protein
MDAFYKAYNLIRANISRNPVQRHLLNSDNKRWDALDNLAGYLVGAEIPGDYMEFGVAQGVTFSYACRKMAPLFNEMRFFAFDSFEGLPKPKGFDIINNYSGGFVQGEFACSEDQFLANLKRNAVNMNKIVTVKGWFDKTLNDELVKKYQIDKVAAAWIDCDFYESTIPVLNFLTQKLSIGSVILFDDWHCYRNLPRYGEQRACHEWLLDNPQIKLYELFNFGWHGKAFTVGSC